MHNNMRRGSLHGRLAVIMVVGLCAAVHAAPFTYSYIANADPTTEAWTKGGVGTNVNYGPVSDTLPAWEIDDNGGTGSSLNYSVFPTAAQVTQAMSDGWVLTGIVKVVDPSTAPSFSAQVRIETGTTRYAMYFGSNASGDAIVGLNGITDLFTISGGGFHTYELRYDPGDSSADLYVDNILTYSGYTGKANTSAILVTWGSTSVTTSADCLYNTVSFSSPIPEPATLMLTIMGLSGLGLFRRKISRM